MKNTNTRNWLILAGHLSGYTFDLLETVAALGHVDVRSISSPLDGQPSFQHERTTEPAENRLWWRNATWLAIRSFVREPRPDAVFVYGNRPLLKLAFALSQVPRSVPLFYAADTNVNGMRASTCKNYLRRLSCLQVCRRADAALNLGETNRQALTVLGFTRIVDLPVYAVDFDALDRAAQIVVARATSDVGKATLLSVARLVPQKNLPEFVAALATDQVLCHRIRLVLIGDGPDREALESIRRRASNLDIELLGAVPRVEIGAHMARADALVLPSKFEPWGIVAVEALGLGLPVIASPAVGAASSLAEQTKAVVLATSAEPGSMLQAVRDFLDRRSEMATQAKMAIPHIRSQYGRSSVARAHLQLVYGDSCKYPGC